MFQPQQPRLTADRTITRPTSKLARLCSVASARGGSLTSPAKVAVALKVTRPRVTQMFGNGKETVGIILNADMVGRVISVFAADGVRCEIDWLYLEYSDFAQRVAASNSSPTAPRGTPPATPSNGWQFTEDTVLPDLVELRLHPPRPGNELPDSHYVDATLLFGTALCDYEPDDGGDPRTISIAVRNARLAIGSESYRPLPGSMLGERGDSAHYKRVAGGVEITGPAPNGTLEGDPIGERHLAVIAATNTGAEPFAVTVAANRGSFVVTDAEAPPERPGANAPSGNRNAILQALVYRHSRKDEAGRAVLARATMRRQAAETDPAP